MAMTVTQITIDVARTYRGKPIICKQKDRNSRYIRARVTDNGRELTIGRDATVYISGARPDDNYKSFKGTVEANGTVLVPLAGWMLEETGIVTCDITIEDKKRNAVLSTVTFDLEVQRSASLGGELITEAEIPSDEPMDIDAPAETPVDPSRPDKPTPEEPEEPELTEDDVNDAVNKAFEDIFG